MSTRRRLVTATTGMALVTVVSRLSGYLRDKVIAVLLGAGGIADAFYTGLLVPNAFRAFLAEGSLHASFIPTLAELKVRDDETAQRRFVRAMTGALLMILPVLVGIGVLAAPALVNLFARGLSRDPATFALAVRLTRLTFPYLGLISLAALAQGVLNVSDRFLLPAATPIALNLCTVAGTVTAVEVLHGSWDWLAIGVVAGGVAQLALQLPACRAVGLALLPGGGGLRHPEVRRVLALMVPGIPALGIYQITLLLSHRFAVGVGEGAATCRFNASRLNELVYGILLVQLTTAVLPMLAAERSRDTSEARRTLGFAIRLLSVIALPSAVFVTMMAREVTGAAFGGGRYTPEAVGTTAGALALYALGLPFLGLTKLLAGASYAWKDTRTPVIAAAVNLVVFFACGVTFTPHWGVAGIAAASSVGQAANAALLLTLNGIAGRLPAARDVLPGVGKHLLAALALGAVLVFVRGHLAPALTTSARALLQLGTVAAGAGVLYLLLLVVLRAPEWHELRRLRSREGKS